MNYGITENENKIINEILKDYVSKYSFFLLWLKNKR